MMLANCICKSLRGPVDYLVVGRHQFDPEVRRVRPSFRWNGFGGFGGTDIHKLAISIVSPRAQQVFGTADGLTPLANMIFPAPVRGPRPAKAVEENAVSVSIGVKEHLLGAPPALYLACKAVPESF